MELKGRKVAFLGDSITEGVGVTNQNNRYDRRLADRYGLEAVNFGISGTRIAHQSIPSNPARFDLCFCGRAFDLPKDADVIVVFGGTNDFGHGDAPFGEDADRTPETYCGAVHYLMDVLKTNYPNAEIVFMTPARRQTDEIPPKHPYTREPKHVLIDYVDQIVRTAGQYGIHVLDLYRELGINPNMEAERVRYAPDGLHLNDEGHAVLAEHLGALLEKL